MLVTSDNDTKFRLTSAGLSRVGDWTRGKLREHSRAEIGSFIFKLMGAIAVTAIIFVVLAGLFARAIFGWGLILNGVVPVLLILVLPILIGCAIQAVIYRKEHGQLSVHGHIVRFRDQHSYLGNPNDNGAEKLWRALLLPAWLTFSAFESLMNCLHLRRADAALCGEILGGLAAADRRVHLPDLEARYGRELVPAMKALVTFPGVMVSEREYPCLLLTSELGDEIRSLM